MTFAASLSVRDSFDPAAQTYIDAVEAADGQALEAEVKRAITRFVKGCKKDSIWTAIKASCILAGARTLSGALVPLVGAAPTNFNFVSGDYNRVTGLIGDGSTKYLDTNRSVTADPQNNCHIAAYVTSGTVSIGSAASTTTGASILINNNPIRGRLRNTTYMVGTIDASSPGFAGFSRSASSGFTARSKGLSETITATSTAFGANANYDVFRFYLTNYFSSRIPFYSIGESINLALLEGRVNQLMTDINNALS